MKLSKKNNDKEQSQSISEIEEELTVKIHSDRPYQATNLICE
jgi:hypothetical protein